MKEKYKQKGLWGIVTPIKFTIASGILVNIVSSIFLVVGILVLAFGLVSYVQSGFITLEFLNDSKILEKILATNDVSFTLGQFVVVVAILSFTSLFLKFISFAISHLGAFKLETILRTDLSSHISRLPLGYITSKGSGDLKKVMVDDVKMLHTFVADSTPAFGKAFFMPFFSLAILFWLDYRLAITTLVVFFLGFVAMSFAMKDNASRRKKYDQAQIKVNKSLIEFVQAMPIVRIFDDGTTSFKKYNVSLKEFRDGLTEWMEPAKVPALFSMLVLSPLPTLVMNIIVGGILFYFHKIQLPYFVASLFLCNVLPDTLMFLMWLRNFIQKSETAALKIQEVFAEPFLLQSSHPQVPANGDITFEHVTFAYKEREVLKDISFEAKEGQVVALVGPSGAGKSTVAKLLPRFWDVGAGNISIGKVNIKDISNEELMKRVSFVFQENFLFNDTIFNNIKIAKETASKEDVIQAAKAAHIHELIMSLENGYDTKVSDRGISLSGGERQRVTIARAILRDAPIIVLDEATAFADSENEEKIIQALVNLTKDKTVLIIAHKLSTIQKADVILVLDKGRIVEFGKHQTLLKANGLYKKLWNNYQEASDWNLEKKEVKNGQ